MLDVFVFENFYENPDEVRDYALNQTFNIEGNYPGWRTKPAVPEQSEKLKNFIQEKIIGEEITHWPEEYNTAYQYTDKDCVTWVHHDATEWAGVVYLTPNAPVDSGTSIYRLKETGVYQWNPDDDSTDYNNGEIPRDITKWEEILSVGNIYNRLVIYKGTYYHRSKIPGFGNGKEDGRLFQTFFFDT